MLGRVRMAIEDDGLTISNPDGFIEGINADNLLDAEPHGRNPVLADAMKRIGLAERTGRGIDRIYEGSLLYGWQLPDYSQSNATSVRLLIPISPPQTAPEVVRTTQFPALVHYISLSVTVLLPERPQVRILSAAPKRSLYCGTATFYL